jgi:hypothetical protein
LPFCECLFERHLFEKQIRHQPPQPRIFELKLGNSGLRRQIALARTVRMSRRGRRQLAPTM